MSFCINCKKSPKECRLYKFGNLKNLPKPKAPYCCIMAERQTVVWEKLNEIIKNMSEEEGKEVIDKIHEIGKINNITDVDEIIAKYYELFKIENQVGV